MRVEDKFGKVSKNKKKTDKKIFPDRYNVVIIRLEKSGKYKILEYAIMQTIKRD